MKKTKLFLTALIGVISIGVFAQGQNGAIRAASYAPADNTGRSINWVQIATPTVATSTDTIFLSPYGGYNIVQPSDSILEKAVFVIQTKPVNYVGDRMEFYCALSKKKAKDTIQFRNKYNTSFKFLSASTKDSNIIILGGKSWYGEMRFNGTYWQLIKNDSIAR